MNPRVDDECKESGTRGYAHLPPVGLTKVTDLRQVVRHIGPIQITRPRCRLKRMPVNRWKRRVFTQRSLPLRVLGPYLLKDTVPGKTLRTATKWYERGLGLWQSWGMFSPNPPNGSSYLRATGYMGWSRSVAGGVGGPTGGEGIRWTYDRSLKFERSALNLKSKHSLREGTGFGCVSVRRTMGLFRACRDVERAFPSCVSDR